MHHRHAKRRLTRVFFGASAVFITAAAITPKAPLRLGVVKADKVASLSFEPGWQQAGAVLKRGSIPSPALPFALDPSEAVRRDAISRWRTIYKYSASYRISPDLARKVFDAAVAEGIEPELGFRLVRVESVFKPRAISSAGAIGLTQLMLSTARVFDSELTREDLLDAETNLRIGFRYLRALIRENRGNLRLALLTYNRGPVAVQNALNSGRDPANGYELVVMRGYRGRGTLD